MLKEEYQHLNSFEAVDNSGLSSEEKEMLKHFLRHIDHVPNIPSVNDLNTVADAYYQGNCIIMVAISNNNVFPYI